jgi:hypothetical protein
MGGERRAQQSARQEQVFQHFNVLWFWPVNRCSSRNRSARLLDEERGFCADASARAAHLKKAFIDLSLQLLWIEQGRQAEYDRLTASPRGPDLKSPVWQ